MKTLQVNHKQMYCYSLKHLIYYTGQKYERNTFVFAPIFHEMNSMILNILHTHTRTLLFVACGMLVHSSSMAVRSFWILALTGTRCLLCVVSRVSQACPMGDMSGEYAGHARTGTFPASRNCVQILATWGHWLSCHNMRWWYNNGPSKCHQQNAPVFFVHNRNPIATMCHSIPPLKLVKTTNCSQVEAPMSTMSM